MLGLFVGALQLFLVLNAFVRSIGGRWGLGAVAGAVRVVLLIAITMATARIKLAGAEPSSAFAIGMFGGPAISMLCFFLAFRRRRGRPAGTEEEVTAAKVMTAWMLVAAIDALFVALAIAGIVMSRVSR